jgi:hypothetical protein
VHRATKSVARFSFQSTAHAPIFIRDNFVRFMTNQTHHTEYRAHVARNARSAKSPQFMRVCVQ